MKKLWNEFVAFVNKGNAFALAIGVIIGGSFTSIVNTINTKIISPLIGALLGNYDLSNSLVLPLAEHKEIIDGVETTVIDNAIYWGAFLQSVIDFTLTAIILFAIFKIVTLILNAAKKAAEKVKDDIEEAVQKRRGDEVVSEEIAEEIVPVEEVVEEVKVSEDILLLTEIRDLLANKAKEDKE